jgi:hypothetical protein
MGCDPQRRIVVAGVGKLRRLRYGGPKPSLSTEYRRIPDCHYRSSRQNESACRLKPLVPALLNEIAAATSGSLQFVELSASE